MDDKHDRYQPAKAAEGLGIGAERYAHELGTADNDIADAESATPGSKPTESASVATARAAVEAATGPTEPEAAPNDQIHTFIDELNARAEDARSDVHTRSSDLQLIDVIENTFSPLKRTRLRKYWQEHQTADAIHIKPPGELDNNPDALEGYIREVAKKGNPWAVRREQMLLRNKIEHPSGKQYREKMLAETHQLGILAAAAGEAAVDHFRRLQSGEPLPENPAARQFVIDLHLETEHSGASTNDARGKRVEETAGNRYDALYGYPPAVEELVRYQLMDAGPAASEWHNAAREADQSKDKFFKPGKFAALKRRIHEAREATASAATKSIGRLRTLQIAT